MAMIERKTGSTKKTTTGKRAASKAGQAPPEKKKAAKKSPSATARKPAPSQWSGHVTETSDAMDLKDGVFKGRDPHKIALSLKHSAEASKRKKGGAFQSAMSMLTFYINRAGHNLSSARLKILKRAKDEIRVVFDRKD